MPGPGSDMLRSQVRLREPLAMSTTAGLHRTFQDADAKAESVFDVLRAGGVAIIPVYAGYGVFGARDEALDAIYAAKRRASHKLFTLVGNLELHRQAQVIDGGAGTLVNRVTTDLGYAFGAVAQMRPEHELIASISPVALARSSRDGGINIILNSGTIMDRLADFSISERLPVFGTSANLSGFGLKGRVKDIEQPVLDAADIVIDEGPLPGYSSTIVDFTRRTTVRFGHRYADVRAIAIEECGLDLPAAPDTSQ